MSGDLNVVSLVRVVQLEEGLQALTVEPTMVRCSSIAGIVLPATVISAAPSVNFDPVEIVVSSGDTPGWLGAAGGTVVARVAPGGGASS